MIEKTTPTGTDDPDVVASLKPKSSGRAKLAGQSLTAAIIRGMQPGEQIADPEHPGLRVRCPLNGRPVFFYRYKNPAGALRQVEIGVLGDMTLTTIRNEWQKLKDAVRNGKDPREDLKAERRQAEAKIKADKVRALTVGDVIEKYLSEVIDPLRKSKGAAECRRLLQQLIRFASWANGQRQKEAPGRRRAKLPKDVVDVADLPALEFTRDKAHDLLVEFGKTAPRSGGMARQELRAAWRHAIASGKLPGPSPFEKMAVGSKDTFGGGALVANSKRERHLAGDEVGALLRWMAEPRSYSRTVGDALELVLRTGLRSGEVCGIHTRELVRREGVLWLDIPAERMKGPPGKQKPHSAPLVGRSEQIVLARMPETGGYLFPAKTGGKSIAQKVLGVEVYSHSGRSTSESYKYRRVCPVADWAPHDLRRTARTLLADLGCPYEVAEAILAHTLPGVAGVYNRAQYDSAKIEWLNKLGDHIDSLAAAQANLSVVEVAA